MYIHTQIHIRQPSFVPLSRVECMNPGTPLRSILHQVFRQLNQPYTYMQYNVENRKHPPEQSIEKIRRKF